MNESEIVVAPVGELDRLKARVDELERRLQMLSVVCAEAERLIGELREMQKEEG